MLNHMLGWGSIFAKNQQSALSYRFYIFFLKLDKLQSLTANHTGTVSSEVYLFQAP